MGLVLIQRVRKLSLQHAYASVQMHEAVARKAGLSGRDHKYLEFLIEKRQMAAGELATLTGLMTGAVTGLIDRFETKKLVSRQFAQGNRRQVIIVPQHRNYPGSFSTALQRILRQLKTHNYFFFSALIHCSETYFLKVIDLMN